MRFGRPFRCIAPGRGSWSCPLCEQPGEGRGCCQPAGGAHGVPGAESSDEWGAGRRECLAVLVGAGMCGDEGVLSDVDQAVSEAAYG